MNGAFSHQQIIDRYLPLLDADTVEFLDQSVEKIVACKRKGAKVVVATGSGPNLHEGVTTLIAELMAKGIIDGIITSSAVIAHEMGGTLDKVKRMDGRELGFGADVLPKGFTFELTEMPEAALTELRHEMELDDDLLTRGRQLDGTTIIKAAGNMAYPMGLRSERLAREIMSIAQAYGLSFETVAGWGADPRTMIGTGAQRGLPVLVSVPQLIGGGGVGLAIADSLSITERCMRISEVLASADVIIESAVALTQEIHDGPYEVYTGHGIWANWDGYRTYSLEGKTLVRIDLDPNLKKAWLAERQSQTVQEAIDQGLPKTKLTGIPFRMEMSGFSRLEGSLPVIGDIGVIWPVLACKVALGLGIELDFVSHPQQTPDGKAMREWIVEQVKPIQRDLMLQTSRTYQTNR
ncbi:MAG: hypothetical protein NT075_35285 [Chloroflexi bacterium]|nr:hypothetical protein [Chloroflexota bacterium]